MYRIVVLWISSEFLCANTSLPPTNSQPPSTPIVPFSQSLISIQKYIIMFFLILCLRVACLKICIVCAFAASRTQQ